MIGRLRYFLDTEFIEAGKTIDLVSIGIVCDDGRELYLCNKDAKLDLASDWVRLNVLPLLTSPCVSSEWQDRQQIRDAVQSFIRPEPKPEVWGYYADYDWVALCQLFGTMMDLPKHFPRYAMGLKQLSVMKGSPEHPPTKEGEHCAIVDARWNCALHRFLVTLSCWSPGCQNQVVAAGRNRACCAIHSSWLTEEPGLMALTCLTGDATLPTGSGPRVIAHIVNTRGGWGKGFVLAVSRRWKEPEREYRRVFRRGELELGSVQVVNVAAGPLWVANMVAQEGYGPGPDGEPPIRYEALRECLGRVATFARGVKASVHMPRIGCGLAGGTWAEVGPIVEAALIGLRVYVYDLAAAQARRQA